MASSTVQTSTLKFLIQNLGLQIQGPASIDIVKAASKGKIDENMKYFRSGFFDLGGQSLYVSRTDLQMNLV